MKPSTPAVEPVAIPDPWMIGENLVRQHGPGLVFDKLIVPHL